MFTSIVTSTKDKNSNCEIVSSRRSHKRRNFKFMNESDKENHNFSLS